MTDTDRIAKAMVPPSMEQQKKREENKPEEKVDEQNGPGEKNQNGQVAPNTPKVNPTPQNDNDDDDMPLVNEAMGVGLNVNTRGMDEESATRDDLYKEHNDEISRLENEYRASMKEDTTADMEREGAKEILEVPNYRQHVSDDQMQGWGRALASFGSVGLKQGANAIDAATKALGEFRKLTRAFLSPNPMSPISQTVASTMVGFNTMYDTIDKAGELAGIKQGADKSIVMETQKGAQYYKDKDNATKAANFIMQTFNDQIRDTLGPQGDVTQLNPAQFTRIYEKMKDGFFDSEMERIKDKHRTGQSLSLEDKAIVNGWKNLNENYKKVLKDKQSTANEYAKEVGVHERAINALDKKNKSVDAWKAGFDDAVKNKDSIGALIRMTLGPEANRRLKDGNVLVETLKGAQDQANSNATNPNFTSEQKEKWLKIANVFGKRVQTVRNMSTEQRRQYALRLSGTTNVVEGAPKAGGRTSKVDDDPYGFLDATKKQREVIVNMTPKQYSDKKIAKWKENHVLETDQATSAKYRNLYKGAMDVVGKMAEEERKAYQNPRMTPEERAQTLEKMEGLKNRLFDLENTLWDRKSLETNDVFDESYRNVYNGMGREDYLKTLPKREKEFPKAKGRSKSAREYNVLIDDYETRKDELDMLRYDFLNGEFKDWRERRNAILKGRHLNRLLDDQRDRLSTMYSALSKAGKKNGMLPGHSFERPEPSGEVEQVYGGSDWKESIDNMDESELKEVIDYAAQDPTDEGRIKLKERAEEAMRNLKSRIDGINEQRDVQEDTEQENKEDETVDADVQGEPPINDTETGEEFDTISKDLKTIDKDELKKRIADLKGLDQDDPQVADLLRMAQERLNAEQPENSEEPAVEPEGETIDERVEEEPVVETEVPESDDTVVSEEMTEPPARLTYKTRMGKEYNDKFEEILNDDELSTSDKRDKIGELLPKINKFIEVAKVEDVKKELRSLRYQMKGMWNLFNKADSSTFDREQQENNAENLKAAEENGPNTEHGEPIVADTSIDDSKIRTPSEDARKADSKELLGKLPENPTELSREEKTRNITERIEGTFGKKGVLFKGVMPKYLDLNDKGEISWDGQASQVIPDKLKEVENKLDAIDTWAGNIKTRGDPQKYRDQAEIILKDIAKRVKFIEDNFAKIRDDSPVKKRMRDLKIAMQTAYRFVYAHDPEKLGDLEPRFTARESAEREKNPKPNPPGPDVLPDDETSTGDKVGETAVGTGTKNQKPDVLPEAPVKLNENMEGILGDLIKNKNSNSEYKDKDSTRNELIDRLNTELVTEQGFLEPAEYKALLKEVEARLQETLPEGGRFKIDVNRNSKSLRPITVSVTRSATPSFEELLKMRLNERYGHFIG